MGLIRPTEHCALPDSPLFPLQPSKFLNTNSRRVLKKHCFQPQKFKHPKRAIQARKGVTNTNTMKYLAILTLAAAALGLSACADREQSSYTTTTTSSTYAPAPSTGYVK